MSLVRNAKNNVSVSSSHNYTKEKVEAVGAFLQKYGKNQRTTTAEEIVEFFNEVRGTNEQVSNCKRCGISKYIVQLQNYYKYGKLILENQGIKINEATTETLKGKPIENAVERIILNEPETPEAPEEPEPIEKVEEVVEVEEPVEKKKAGRPKKVE